jgi:hypothetical protein
VLNIVSTAVLHHLFWPRVRSDAGQIERDVTAFAIGANGGSIVTASGLATVHRNLIVHAGSPAQAARGLRDSLIRRRRRGRIPEGLFAPGTVT